MRLLFLHTKPEGKELIVNPDHIVRCLPLITGGSQIGVKFS